MNRPEIKTQPSDEQMHRWIYSIWDFQQATSALAFLAAEYNEDSSYNAIQWRRLRCYESQAVIAFCRPFSTSRSGVELSCNRIGAKLNRSESKLKNRVMLLRNKIVAHSDSEEMHYCVSTLDFSCEQNTLFWPNFQFDETLHLRSRDIIGLDALSGKLLAAVMDHLISIFKSFPELFEKYKRRQAWNSE